MTQTDEVDEFWEQATTNLKDMITRVVAKHEDIPMTIVPAKSGKILAWVSPPPGPRANFMSVMRIIIIGMEPDELIWLTDGYKSNSRTKHDGTPWEHGEMEKAYLLNTEDKDLVQEIASLLRMDRVGGIRSYSVEYTRDEDTVIFGETNEAGRFIGDAPEGAAIGGYVVDELRNYFDHETYRQHLLREDPNSPILEVPEEDFTAFTTAMVVENALLPMGCLVIPAEGQVMTDDNWMVASFDDQERDKS